MDWTDLLLISPSHLHVDFIILQRAGVRSVKILTKQASEPGRPYKAWKAALDVYYNDTEVSAEPVAAPSRKRVLTATDMSNIPQVWNIPHV